MKKLFQIEFKRRTYRVIALNKFDALIQVCKKFDYYAFDWDTRQYCFSLSRNNKRKHTQYLYIKEDKSFIF